MIIETLKEVGALLEGHFLLSSGFHSDKYIQCARLLQYPDLSAKVLKGVVDKITDWDFDAIIGPAIGGIIVSYELGRLMGKRTFFSERENGRMIFRRGFTLDKGSRVLIAEDVITTGKSVLEVAELVESCGAQVAGIACIVMRTKKDIGYMVYSGAYVDADNYKPEECPLCEKGLSIQKPGSRIMI